MRKLLLSFLLQCILCATYAQDITGNWIKAKVSYRDGTELEDNQLLKYSYMRYTFGAKGKAKIATVYHDNGNPVSFTLKNKLLSIKNSSGFIMNNFLIESANDTSLIMLQKGASSFSDENCLRFYFVAESQYQSSYHPGPDGIQSVSGNDTIYMAGPQLYPIFKGDKSYFDALKEGVPSQPSANLYFLATYVVKKNGEADSLKILESFDENFDKMIIKNFNKTKNNWQPAVLHGKPVDVQMVQEYKYSSFDTAYPAMDYYRKGASAMKEKDYSAALYYFDLGLGKMPSDVQMLYGRAVCKYELGNVQGACKDLNIIKLLGDKLADELLLKWCK